MRFHGENLKKFGLIILILGPSGEVNKVELTIKKKTSTTKY